MRRTVDPAAARKTHLTSSRSPADTNDLYVWGRRAGDNRELVLEPSPIQLAEIVKAQKVRAGAASCALDGDGVLWCWGWNDDGALGDGTEISRTAPRPVTLPEPVVDFDVLLFTVCAVLESGAVYCWGSNQSYLLGRGESTGAGSSTPAPVASTTDAISIEIGPDAACVITRQRGLMCWGVNGGTALGSDLPDRVFEPAPVLGIEDVQSLAMCGATLCVLHSDRSARARVTSPPVASKHVRE